jgi:hypothetical protein
LRGANGSIALSAISLIRTNDYSSRSTRSVQLPSKLPRSTFLIIDQTVKARIVILHISWKDRTGKQRGYLSQGSASYQVASIHVLLEKDRGKTEFHHPIRDTQDTRTDGWTVAFVFSPTWGCNGVACSGRSASARSAPLFPGCAFSHDVVWFFQVVRQGGSAAKFIQSAKLCSTPCRLPEGSSPTDERWEPELNARLRT